MVTLIDQNLRDELWGTVRKYSGYTDHREVLWALADVVGDVLANIKDEEEQEYVRVFVNHHIKQQLQQHHEQQVWRARLEQRRQGVLPLESN
jgi:hypothetical protein